MADFTSWGLSEISRGPLVLTGYTTEDISAGFLIRPSAGCTADLVTSAGMTSYDPKGDIKIQRCDADADASFACGIALEDISSGSYGSFTMDGVYLLRTQSAINAGQPVMFPSTGTMVVGSANCVSAALVTSLWPIGRALTSASAAEKFIVVRLRG